MSCWSTNYTQQERDKLKKKFSNHYPEYKARPGYKKTSENWILDYKSIKDDNKYIAWYFGNSSIGIENNNTPELELYYVESKQFHTSIGQLQSF